MPASLWPSRATRASGAPFHPDEAQLTEDIESGGAWLCRENGALLAAFYFAPGPDADYAVIREGSWLEEERPYWVIHRVASYGGRGAAAYCLDWCWQRCDNLRIDTHRDNLPMQAAAGKSAASGCGAW